MKYIIFLFIFFDTVFSNENKQVGNLIMESVPNIPLDISEQSRKYRNTRSASCRSWLRDGSGMIIGTRFGETSQLHMRTCQWVLEIRLPFLMNQSVVAI